MAKWWLVIVTLAIIGCSSDVSEYRDQSPEFRLESFFDGQVRAYGMVNGFNGDVARRFTVDISGRWQEDSGVLDEYFQFADGEQQYRQWRITKLAGNAYEGRADDVIGKATGIQAGPVLQWQYELSMTVDGDTWNVTFDDQMVLIDEQHMLNRAKIKKFGLTVAEVLLFFEKVPQTAETAALTPKD